MAESRKTPLQMIVATAEKFCHPMGRDRNLSLIMGSAFAAFILAILLLAIMMPGYPYDLVPYLGAALGGDAVQNHQTAWGLVEAQAPPEVFTDLATADEYRQRQSSDPTAFDSILPLYAAKVGYIALLKFLSPLTGWLQAAFWSNYLAGALLGATCFYWMKLSKTLQGAGLVAAVLLAGNYIDLVAYPSPDMIASALIITAILLWLREHDLPAMTLLLAAFLFRPDTIVFVFALLIGSVAMRVGFWKVLSLFGTLVVLSIMIRSSVEHPGWWIHYYFSTVRIQNTLQDFSPAFSLFDWSKGQARGVFMAFKDFNWPVLLIALFAGVITSIRFGYSYGQRQTAMLMACILTIGGKFIVFPLPDDRLYLPFLLAGTLIVMDVMKPRLAWNKG